MCKYVGIGSCKSGNMDGKNSSWEMQDSYSMCTALPCRLWRGGVSPSWCPVAAFNTGGKAQ